MRTLNPFSIKVKPILQKRIYTTQENTSTVFISILNWNGWRDTIECLTSINKLTKQNIRVVVLDNNSSDNSIDELVSWFEAQNQYGEMSYVLYDISEITKGGTLAGENILSENTTRLKVVLIQSNINLGFAAGNNVIINYALSKQASYVWILNNDTVVQPNSLDILIQLMQTRKELYGITPQIRYENPREIVWNCGGMLNWHGTKNYLFSDTHYSELPKEGSRQITFVTGCAMLVRGNVFSKLGLLSERYFFGTEDLEFSQRIKDNGGKLAVAFESVIYHKVNRATNLNPQKSMVYNHYLGIFINMRFRINIHLWRLWRFGYCQYLSYLFLFKLGYSLKDSMKILRSLVKQSNSLDKIDRESFEEAIFDFK